MAVGKLIDVVDFMSKWTNAIVIKVDKNKKMMEVVVDGDLEMEITKEAIVSIINGVFYPIIFMSQIFD
jgi:hypothetical protein